MAAGRVPTVAEEPGGLRYVPDLVTEAEERSLVETFDEGAFEEVRMRGQTALRTVRHYDHRYDYEGWRLVAADALPDSMAWLRERAAALADERVITPLSAELAAYERFCAALARARR